MKLRQTALGFALVVLYGALTGCTEKGLPPATTPPPYWSIGIVQGDHWKALREISGASNPRFRPTDIPDVDAQFVADPFIVHEHDRWYLFFELFNQKINRGEIGVAESRDLMSWTFLDVIISEPFHLSYPFVFKEQGSYYMIPESRAANEVRLYRSHRFPVDWRFEKTLVVGQYVDSSLVQFNGRWWLFSGLSPYSLAIFSAPSFRGPWREHPQSPLYPADPSRSRPAGRPLVVEGKLFRFVQDNREGYGKKVRVMAVDVLSQQEFSEHSAEPDPFLAPHGSDWRWNGMHHFAAIQMTDGRWVAALDGSGNGLPERP